MSRTSDSDTDRPLADINRGLLIQKRRNGADGAHYAKATLKSRRTRRQRIVELARAGRSDAQIAAELHLSVEKVRWYRGL